ncbi:hypothetical protein ACFL96_17835 [Thermoproteota archaeon]
MVKVIAGFKPFLNYKRNSTEEFLKKIPDSNNIKKVILPVWYSKHAILRPIKKYNPSTYIILGMWQGNHIKTETVAKNEYLTFKNPFMRLFIRILSLFRINYKTDKKIPKNKLITFPIDKNKRKEIKIKPVKGIKTSKDAGNFVCNYAIWVVRQYKPKTNFHFIHVPENMNKTQEKRLLKIILS